MSERWCPVVGFEGFYEVSDAGRVRSIDRWFIKSNGWRQFRRGRVLAQGLAGRQRNYPSVTLRFGLRRNVHVLVCEAFHGPPPLGDGWEVAHGNGDPSDNRPENLRWATRSENQQDSIRHGTKPRWEHGETAGESNGRAKLTAEQVHSIRLAYASGGHTHRGLAEQFNVGKSQIGNILSGKRWAEWAT